MAFEIGQKVGIPCETKPGAFNTESFVSMETVDGPVSGFVLNDRVYHKEGKPYLQGIVVAISDRILTVLIQGSFFTTSGEANFNEDYLMAA